ncbi:MAG: ECF transporter S component [Syntrophomonadaceae bacterium]
MQVKIIIAALAGLLALFALYRGEFTYSPGFVAIVLVLLILLTFYWWVNKTAVNSKQLAIIATLAALAAVGRIPFAAIPSVQPTTFLIIISGFVFGPRAGFLVGSTAALVSNFFLGQGPWTPWQMLGWGLAGISAGYLYRLKPGISSLGWGIFGACWGFVFSWIQNAGFWLVFVYPLTIKTFLAAYATSFPFDLAHAAGNFLFCFFLAWPTIKILSQYKEDFAN